jgi:signal transduction histidine kinase
MKTNEPLEPGLLSIFRIFLLIQFGLIAFFALVHMHLGELKGCPYCILGVAAGGITLLLLYLATRRLQARRFFLPLALIFSIFISLLVQNELIQSFIDPAKYTSDENAWLTFLFLFFPLVLVAWQYNFPAVVSFCLLSAGLEVVMLHFGNYTWFHQLSYQRSLMIRTIVFLAAGLVISLIMKRQREQRQELLAANQQLRHYAATLEQLAVTQERNRVARELHDTLAHTLSGLAVQLEAVRSIWRSAPEKSYTMLEDSLQTTRAGLTESRQAIQALRASPLEDLGLILALRNLAESAASRAGTTLNLELPGSLEKLPPDVEQSLFRAAQEALENIVRHAEAKSIEVQLTQEVHSLTLSIRDDGQGFEPEKVDAQKHLGLKGLRERVELFGGNLQIQSKPGQGTTIRLELAQ